MTSRVLAMVAMVATMRLIACAVGICLAVFAPGEARAQSATGSIEGTVVDQTGALMPGVTVTAEHSATRTTRTVVTDENGVFRIPLLPVGVYNVSVELAGFISRKFPEIT